MGAHNNITSHNNTPFLEHAATTRMRTSTSLGIDGLDQLTVLLVDHAALELERGGEVARLLAEVHRKPHPLIHNLSIRCGLAVGSLDSSVDILLPERVGLGFSVRGGSTADLLGHKQCISSQLVSRHRIAIHIHLERDEHGQELALVANHHAVGHSHHRSLDLVLDQHGGHVLATGSDDQLLDTASDAHEARGAVNVLIAVIIKGGNVTTVQISLLIDGLGCLFRHVHVPHEDVAAAVAELTSVGIQLALGALHGASAGADLPALGGRHRVRPCALGLAKHLVDGNVQRSKVVNCLGSDGGRSSKARLGLIQAQSLLDLAQNQRVGTPIAARSPTAIPVLRHLAVLSA
mmetsp:Transcript_18577/g.37753  ORF Transcript_18577/g.37753 Transcript_18577/m.37753 type:complete len:348 (-) Transcript_18577:982-2025(-)